MPRLSAAVSGCGVSSPLTHQRDNGTRCRRHAERTPPHIYVTQTRKSLFWAWLPVILWVGIIAVESTGMMSSDNTDGVLYAVVSAIFGHIDRHRFDIFHAVLRKCGHFTGYAILSLLFFRALLNTFSLATAAAAYRSFAVASIVFTFVVASLDEWHQTFLPKRTGKFSDVLLDTAGAIAVQVALLLVLRIRQSKLANATQNLTDVSVSK
jgi:VanZ family protein